MEIRKLNTLRGLAALIVLISHFSEATNWLSGVLGAGAGQYGVMIFFMLSGFLMSYLYMTKDFNKINISKYLLARIGRILPLFFAIAVFSYLFKIFGVEGLYNIPDAKSLLSHVLFLDGESVLWSIGPEVQFYLIFIPLWWLASWREGYLYVMFSIILALIFFTNFPRPYGKLAGISYDFYIVRNIPYFFIGIIFGRCYSLIKIPEYLCSGFFIFTLVFIPFMYPEFTWVTTGDKYQMWRSFEVLSIISMVFFSIVFLVPKNNIFLENKIGDFFGKISYSLYLLHLPILWQIEKLNLTVEASLIIFLFSSSAAAYISYSFLEAPLAKWIRGFLSSKRSQSEGVNITFV